MSNRRIRNILESRLSAWAQAKPIPMAVQNFAFDPVDGVFLSFSIIPAETGSEDEEGAHRLYTGIFQVSVVMPKNKGTSEAETIAEELDALFPKNLRLEDDGFVVTIIRPMSAGPLISESDKATLPVYCAYRADTI